MEHAVSSTSSTLLQLLHFTRMPVRDEIDFVESEASARVLSLSLERVGESFMACA